jgi:thiol-disulfide isomerase/thioredoxin
MKRHLALILIVIQFFQLNGQTFTDCSNNYHDAFNKVQLQRTLKRVDNNTADSLISVLNASLDSCIIGKEMPDYSLVGLSGKIYTNESLKGKVVLFNFWSVNCGPCVVEIPALNKLYLSYKDNKDFVFISILLDKEEDLEKFLEKGLTKRRIVYEVIPNSKAILKDKFKSIKAYPTNLFIDREGKIFMKTIGGIIDSKDEQKLEAKLRSIIDNELNKSADAR